MSAQEYLSYTYLIGWTKQDLWYYGCRWANKCSPEDDLWHKYKTHGTRIPKTIERYGEPDVIQVRKTFDTAVQAQQWEKQVLIRMRVLEKENWLNQNIAGVIFHTKEIRRKISEAAKGRKPPPFSKEHKQKIRESKLGKPRSEETKRKLREANTGKKHTEETKRKMSETRKGGNSTSFRKGHRPWIRGKKGINMGHKNSEFRGYYITPWGTYESKNLAVAAGPVKISTNAIRNWCYYSYKQISMRSICRSSYLTKDMLGLTFAEIGFGFIPK